MEYKMDCKLPSAWLGSKSRIWSSGSSCGVTGMLMASLIHDLRCCWGKKCIGCCIIMSEEDLYTMRERGSVPLVTMVTNGCSSQSSSPDSQVGALWVIMLYPIWLINQWFIVFCFFYPCCECHRYSGKCCKYYLVNLNLEQASIQEGSSLNSSFVIDCS